MITLAVDIGGTGTKVMLLDAEGKPISEETRERTPNPSTPKAIMKVIATMASAKGAFDRVSVGFPAVVKDGVTAKPWNLDTGWTGFPLARELGNLLGKPVRAANDADVQGFGAVSGRGVELVITLGTGFGSALFHDGRLIPNLELAHHTFRKGKTFEDYLGKAALMKRGRNRWNKALANVMADLNMVFNYDRLYIGGGNARKIDLDLPKNVQIVPNTDGLLGGIALWNDLYSPAK
jgi:polyphosphate glucokinase